MFTSCAPRLIRRFASIESARATSFQKFSRVTAPPISIGKSEDGNDAVVHIPIQEARDTTAKALQKLGWDADDAALQAEIMTSAELCGNNQVSFDV